LTDNGFGVLTEIDVKTTFKKKLDADFRNYMILGACSPSHAFQAISAEDKIGTMLPCNVTVQEKEPGQIEVAAVAPVASMVSVDNPALGGVATKVQAKLKTVIESL
jgi:uncharacterized protein (DUF302 family)